MSYICHRNDSLTHLNHKNGEDTMKKVVLLLTAVAFVLAGCGKSDEQKKMEADLWAQVTKLHDGQMAQVKGFDDLLGKVDATVAMHDTLAMKFPKELAGHNMDDLTAAKEKLTAVKASMDTWMKEFKPYNVDMPHTEAMTTMKKNVEDLTKMGTEIEGAIGAANTALDSHKAFAADLMTKMKAIKKK